MSEAAATSSAIVVVASTTSMSLRRTEWAMASSTSGPRVVDLLRDGEQARREAKLALLRRLERDLEAHASVGGGDEVDDAAQAQRPFPFRHREHALVLRGADQLQGPPSLARADEEHVQAGEARRVEHPAHDK